MVGVCLTRGPWFFLFLQQPRRAAALGSCPEHTLADGNGHFVGLGSGLASRRLERGASRRSPGHPDLLDDGGAPRRPRPGARAWLAFIRGAQWMVPNGRLGLYRF